jgi:hypothetical protein
MDSEDWPNFDEEPVDKMMKLKRARVDGNFDEVFSQVFPTESVADQPADE